MDKNSTNRMCLCGCCVTCSCAAIPKMDEDGLCATCGGQPLLMAMLDGDRPNPHVGTEVEGDDRTEIEAIIAGGIAPSDLAPYLTAIDEDGVRQIGGANSTAPLDLSAIEATRLRVARGMGFVCDNGTGRLVLVHVPALLARVRELEAERDGLRMALDERGGRS